MRRPVLLVVILALGLGGWGCAAGGLPVQIEFPVIEPPSTWTELAPPSEYYVRRWGARLRETPDSRGKVVDKLRLNDRVKKLYEIPAGWAKIYVERTERTGWIELQYLSTKRIATRPPKREPAAEPEEAEKTTPEKVEEAPPEETAPKVTEGLPPPPALLTPAPAEAAPPPPQKPKAKPEMFEPF